MAAAYQAGGVTHQATFELFVRNLPDERRFLVAAGLDDALAGLEAGATTPATWPTSPAWASSPRRSSTTSPTCGSPATCGPCPRARSCSPASPSCGSPRRWSRPRWSRRGCSTGSPARRCWRPRPRVALACGDRAFVDFSARRVHGVDAAMAAARAAWICGAAGTSLVAAGRRFGIPLSGTMAHSFVMSYDDERDAFRAYAAPSPTGRAAHRHLRHGRRARRAAEVAHELAAEGIAIAGVRLDSGDLADLSVRVRPCSTTPACPTSPSSPRATSTSTASPRLLAAGAPIDAFGVGTQLGTSADAPALGAVYKLVEDADGPKMKLACREGHPARPQAGVAARRPRRRVAPRRGRAGRPPAAHPGHGRGRRTRHRGSGRTCGRGPRRRSPGCRHRSVARSGRARAAVAGGDVAGPRRLAARVHAGLDAERSVTG